MHTSMTKCFMTTDTALALNKQLLLEEGCLQLCCIISLPSFAVAHVLRGVWTLQGGVDT